MNDQIKKVRKNLARKAARFRSVFESSDGEEVLKDLEKEFLAKSLIGEDNHKTIILAAQADVIMYINSLIKYKEGDDNESD